ncbi:MAG: DUF4349 domain-containing protein [Dermatophilaceae bacterium]
MHFALSHREFPWRVRPTEPTRHTRRDLSRRTLIATATLSALLLSSCSNGGDSATSASELSLNGSAPARNSAGFTPATGTKSDAAAASGGAAVKPGAAANPGAAPVAGIGQKLAKNASLDLRVKDIGAAAAQVRRIATGLQALVLGEQIGKGGPGEPQPLEGGSESFGGFGTLTLSVPADKLDIALDQLAKIGTVLQRNTASQDVTSQYVDTQSRLKTMTASVERVRALMAQAKDLGQVVALEGELSRREADLESLQSQLDALKTSVDRSTLAVSLSTPGNEPVTDNSFIAGLRSGWSAFTASAAGLFTGIGAALPFAVFLALFATPVWGWWRRRRANQPAVVPVSTPAA